MSLETICPVTVGFNRATFACFTIWRLGKVRSSCLRRDVSVCCLLALQFEMTIGGLLEAACRAIDWLRLVRVQRVVSWLLAVALGANGG